MNDKDKLDELERHYFSQLAELQKSYRELAEPIIARLVELRNIRGPKPLVLPFEFSVTVPPHTPDLHIKQFNIKIEGKGGL